MSVSEAQRAVAALIELMARLRDPQNGCPWDREQTFATIAPYTLEEAYEVADAIERGDPQALREELGDLLFQVVFHARMAEEKGWFDFAAVATALHDKLVRRHPHVFGGAPAEDPDRLVHLWEAQKAREREEAAARKGAREVSLLDDIPKALPALARAYKLGKRAARVGFDWPDARGARAKIDEELGEATAAVNASAAANDAAVAEEIGDVLFALVNWSRHLKVDPEAALRAANSKFERRFRRMEALARERGLDLAALSADEWDGLWNEAKAAESAR